MNSGKKIWVAPSDEFDIMYDSEDCEAECNGDKKCEAACYDEEHEVDYEDRFWFRKDDDLNGFTGINFREPEEYHPG